MEITKGVRLHFIQSEKFKTNKIKVRFSAPMSKRNSSWSGFNSQHARNCQCCLSYFAGFQGTFGQFVWELIILRVFQGRGLVHYF